MRRHFIDHLLLSSILAFSAASPLKHLRHLRQQILSEPPRLQPAMPLAEQVAYRPSSYLDVRPNAVVLSLMAEGEDMARYFFLPVGKSVQTHSRPELPLHPLTAHIVGAVDAEGFVVPQRGLQGVECAIYPAWNRTLNRGKTVRDFVIRLAHGDGVVDFSIAEQPFWLGSLEVEAYECW